MMRIAYLDELAFTRAHGGSAAATVQLARRMQKRGIESTVYSFARGIHSVIPDRIKLAPNIRELFVFPCTGRKIIPLLEKKYDIIHFSSTTTSLLQKAQIPTVVTCHCLFSRQTLLCSKWLPVQYRLLFNTASYSFFLWAEKRSLQKCDHIIAPKSKIEDFLVHELGISKEKIAVIHQGVDTTFFRPSPTKSDYILFVGRPSRAKGFDTLLKAKKFMETKIVAVLPQKSTFSEQKGMKVLSAVDSETLLTLYQRARLFVMPSLSETGPLVTLEAMACGLPIVCTEEGGGDFVENGINGTIIPVGEPKILAEKVNSILSDSAIERKFARESRSRAEMFSLRRTAEKTEKVYRILHG